MAPENRPSALPTESPWRRLRRALMAETPAPAPAQRAVRSEAGRDEEQLAALEGWLRGLELVQERFLKLLAFEGIQPIGAEGEAFDPRLHLAVQAERRADVAPGTVTKVLRKGYRLRERVLRYAEVVVSRGQGPTGEAREAGQGPAAGESAFADSQGAAPTNEERDL